MNELAEANQAYGALIEAFYLAGFSFERAMGSTLRLLKKDAWRKVGDGFDDVNEFVRSLHLDRFKVLADQRKEFRERVKALQPEVSNRAIAEALGVGRETINRDARGGQNGPLGDGKAKGNGKAGGPHGPAGGRRDASILANRDERAERRDEKYASLIAAAKLAGLYSVIYADPPWQDDFGFNDRAVDTRYPLMSLEAIEALKISDSSASDSVLFLWAMPHNFPSALRVIVAWGFDYRTHIIWAKDKTGLGEWARNQHELLLIARRGAFPPPPTDVRSPSIVEAPLGEHSVKPDVFAELIERWYPDAPKIELFRRGLARPGWQAWGNEAEAA
jgi:N6-adenosine-specific RNA methylase IME4